MTLFLRQSTAGQDVVLGPFVDDTDFKSPKTALSIANTDVKLFKDGASSVDKNTGGGTHLGSGAYGFTFNASDTDVVGQLLILIDVAGALAVWVEAQVIEEAVYDIQYAAASTGEVTADIVKVDGVTAAATNLSDTYDGTGYTNDVAPAKQSQLDSLANVGAAVHKAANSYTENDLPSSPPSISNTFAATQALDGIYHSFEGITTTAAAGEEFDIEYEFNIGSGTPSGIQLTGYLTGINDVLRVFAWDYQAGSPDWVQVGIMQGTASTANQTFAYDLFVGMVGTGANKGKVRFRLYNDGGPTDTVLSNADLFIDQLFASYNQGVEGYERASIWYDSNGVTNAGIIVNVDGTPSNPVTTVAAVDSLLAAANLNGITNIAGSTYTTVANQSYLLIHNQGGTIDLAGFQYTDVHIMGGVISGTAVVPSGEIEFHRCEFEGAASSIQSSAHFYDCTFVENGATSLTLDNAGGYRFINCQSGVAGAGSPTIILGAGIKTVEFRRWSGSIRIEGIISGDVLTISGELGTVTLVGADGSVEIRGTYKGITDSRTGSPVLNTAGAIQGSQVEAIKTETDKLTFTDGVNIDANIQKVNDVTVIGDGELGTEWNPA